MNHCKDCKWWEAVTEADIRAWSSGGEYRGMGVCERVNGEPFDKPRYEGVLAFVNDHHAALMTRPEFGCVMFEAEE
jgi:hypothetical protein